MKSTTIIVMGLVLVVALFFTACAATTHRSRINTIEQSVIDYAHQMACLTPEYRFAPELCMAPPPSGARMSQADPLTPHGRKLYHLYVSNTKGYFEASEGTTPAPVGLTLVKESHMAFVAGINNNARSSDSVKLAYVPGPVTELFLMNKIGEQDTPETDQGWVYSVANPAGEIQVSGLIESCMKCHVKAPNDRLFGLAPATTVYVELRD